MLREPSLPASAHAKFASDPVQARQYTQTCARSQANTFRNVQKLCPVPSKPYPIYAKPRPTMIKPVSDIPCVCTQTSVNLRTDITGCHGSALNMLSGRISAFPCRHAANNRCGALPGIPTKTVRKAYAARYPVPKPSADRTHRSEIPRPSTAPRPAIPEKLLRTSTRTHFPASGFCFSA